MVGSSPGPTPDRAIDTEARHRNGHDASIPPRQVQGVRQGPSGKENGKGNAASPKTHPTMKIATPARVAVDPPDDPFGPLQASTSKRIQRPLEPLRTIPVRAAPAAKAPTANVDTSKEEAASIKTVLASVSAGNELHVVGVVPRGDRGQDKAGASKKKHMQRRRKDAKGRSEEAPIGTVGGGKSESKKDKGVDTDMTFMVTSEVSMSSATQCRSPRGADTHRLCLHR